MTRAPDYRPEIDGLRALAVLSVLAFHLGLPWLGGGFVGVDVFFVISGFLITQHIHREISGGSFEFGKFFLRRLRRLGPALLVMTLGSCLVSYFILLPSDMMSFAKSVIAQPLALQNVHYLAEGEYFVGSDSKALLHTWSLAVEEQFYLVWPVALLLLGRLTFPVRIGVLGVLLAASFSLCLLLPALSPKAAFFLLPARAWELGVGCLLALLRAGRPATAGEPGLALNLLGVGSAVALAASFHLISPRMLFPGWVALAPVAATGLLLDLTTREASWMRRFLSQPLLVHTGRISYSLYLWHWPVIVFARHLGFEPSEPESALAIFVLSLGLAELSYQLVEQPVRRKRLLPGNRALVATVAAAGLCMMAAGFGAVESQGAAFRYDEPARSMLTAAFSASRSRCGFFFRVFNPRAELCAIHQATPRDSRGGVLLWGNSHGDMWSELFRELGREYQTNVYLNARNCRATMDNSFCSAPGPGILEFIDEHDLEHVVLASTWYGSYGRPDEAFEADMEAVVRALSARGSEVWLVLDVPTSTDFDPVARYLSEPGAPTFGRLSRADFDAQMHARERRFADHLANSVPRVHVVNPSAQLCFDSQYCYGGRAEETWYHDTNHLTHAGARTARGSFQAIFERLAQSRRAQR